MENSMKNYFENGAYPYVLLQLTFVCLRQSVLLLFILLLNAIWYKYTYLNITNRTICTLYVTLV